MLPLPIKTLLPITILPTRNDLSGNIFDTLLSCVMNVQPPAIETCCLLKMKKLEMLLAILCLTNLSLELPLTFWLVHNIS